MYMGCIYLSSWLSNRYISTRLSLFCHDVWLFCHVYGALLSRVWGSFVICVRGSFVICMETGLYWAQCGSFVMFMGVIVMYMETGLFFDLHRAFLWCIWGSFIMYIGLYWYVLYWYVYYWYVYGPLLWCECRQASSVMYRIFFRDVWGSFVTYEELFCDICGALLWHMRSSFVTYEELFCHAYGNRALLWCT